MKYEWDKKSDDESDDESYHESDDESDDEKINNMLEKDGKTTSSN